MCFLSGFFMMDIFLDIVLLDILEVSVSVNLEFSDSELVSYDDAVWMSLESREGACL